MKKGSKIRTVFRPIEGTERTEGTIKKVNCEKVLQGKTWYMLRYRDCYTCLEEPDGDEFYPIKSEKYFSDDWWNARLSEDIYVSFFFGWFLIKL